jgi:predicted nucleotidyltransferase
MYQKVSELKKKKIEKYIVDILKKHKSVKGAIVYGSFVNRKYFRDIDLVLMGKISEKEREKISSEIEKGLGIEIDIKIFEELTPFFKFISFKNGKILFSRDPSEIILAKRNSIVRYLDFKPVKEFHDKIWLG